MYNQAYIRQRVAPRSQASSAGCLRIGLALAMAAIAIISFLGSKQFNPVTGEDQYVSISQDQEIAMGMAAAPEMAAEFGGLDRDPDYQNYIDAVGQALVEGSVAASSGYPFEFYVLADTQTINAMALPGGPVFVTRGLVDLMETDGQVAGVVAHEISHVLARHSAEQIAQAQLTQGITGAVLIASYDPDNPSSQQAAAMAAMIGQLINMRFGREDELQADSLGLQVMAEAGFDPRSMIRTMELLAAANPASGMMPEFFSTHPNPENRIQRIEEAIQELYPNGVPEGLIP
jgi:predicted Zn-dependent protease